MIRRLFLSAAALTAFAPVLARAQSGTITDTVFDVPDLGPMSDPKQPGYGFCLLGFFCDLSLHPGENYFYTIVRYAASFIGLVLVLILLYGAARVFLSFSDPEGFKKGKSAIIAALVGFIVLLFAYGMVIAFTRITK